MIQEETPLRFVCDDLCVCLHMLVLIWLGYVLMSECRMEMRHGLGTCNCVRGVHGYMKDSHTEEAKCSLLMMA
jgi:hypothetical protein